MDKSEARQEIPFVVWVRAISVFLILFCHLAQTHTNPYVVMSSQLFNVGVHIFIIISGFLFGYMGVKKPYRNWLDKRLKRIYLPYWLFLFVVLGLQLARGQKIDVLAICFSVIGMHRFQYVFPGSEHTWFVSAILLCYFITPLLDMTVAKLNESNHKKWSGLLICILLAAPAVAAYMPDAAILQMCLFYSISFVIGKRWDAVKITKRRAVCCTACVFAAFTIRFLARFFVDGMIFYSGIVVSYTHFVAGLCFFMAASWWFDTKPWKMVSFVSKVSFEVYLYHYMFVWPPLSVMSVTESWIINCLIAIVLSFLIARIMNGVVKPIYSLIEKKQRIEGK